MSMSFSRKSRRGRARFWCEPVELRRLLSGAVAVFTQPAGIFAPPAFYDIARPSASIASGDITNDGHADVVVCDYSGNTILVLPGAGAGTFVAGLRTIIAQTKSVPITDLNHDGYVDNLGSGNESYRVGLAAPDGSLRAAEHLTSYGFNADLPVIADVDHDGNVDLITGNHLTPTGPVTGSLYVLRGYGWHIHFDPLF